MTDTGAQKSSRAIGKGRWAILIFLFVATSLLTAYLLLRGSTETQKLTERVYLIQSTSPLFPDGSNSIALQTTNGIVLVDTQLSIWTGRVQDAVITIFDAPASIVVNTHWHADHSGGNDQLTEAAEIVAHENVLRILSRPHEGFGLTEPGSHHTYEPREKSGLPETVYDGLLTLAPTKRGGLVEVVHFPNAHTDGDSVVFIDDEKVVAAGDIIWPGSFPFIDLHNGGNALGLLAAIDVILARTDPQSIIVGGHQNPVTHAELTIYQQNIAETIEIIRVAKAASKPLETIIADGLPVRYAPLSGDVVPEATWISMVYHSLE
jgi:cyclase